MSGEKIFKHGELEAVLDISDFVVAGRIDAALTELAATGEKTKNAASPIEKLKIIFYAYAKVLDSAFDDPDAANKALGKSTSLDAAIDAVMALLDFTRAQDAALADKWINAAKKYTPANREQRRAAK